MDDIDPFAGESGGTGTVSSERLAQELLAQVVSGNYVCDACPGCFDVCAFKHCSLCAPKRREFSQDSGCYTMCQVRRHTKKEDCWLVAHRRVYDATNFLSMHPAGPRPILSRAGGDCTVDYDFHSSVSQREYWKPLCIGKVIPCPRCDCSASTQCVIS